MKGNPIEGKQKGGAQIDIIYPYRQAEIMKMMGKSRIIKLEMKTCIYTKILHFWAKALVFYGENLLRCKAQSR